jgi:hypothetical protein
MALVDPPLDTIKKLRVQPTEGEWKLIQFLAATLDDSYEIFVQPYVNGDNPDIAVLRKGSGLLIIEVKDWDLGSYTIDVNTNWHVRSNGAIIKSPLKQVDSYKQNLFKLHSEELYRANVTNHNLWATVNCGVYFHKPNHSQILSFLLSPFNDKRYAKYNKFVSYFALWGSDSLTPGTLKSTLSKFWMNRQSKYFNDELYFSVRRYLKAPFHKIEEGIPITYSKEQQELIRSEIRPRRKIKGVAGSGKTFVLAKRAVNAHKRTNGKVLILTYNLALKNYIQDRINDVREEFFWENFYITNYHQFFKAQANNYNLEIESLDSWNDTEFFEPAKGLIKKFDVVLIDEIQDYEQEWIDIITKYFTHPETELAVFGDEKQNIYERELDENNEPIVRTIAGSWNKSLNTSYRFASNIGNIALRFQKEVFQKKYVADDLRVLSQLDFQKRIIQYHFFHKHSVEQLYRYLFSVLLKNEIHPSDVGILSSKVEVLRELDFLIKTKKKEGTMTTFESKEEYDGWWDEASKRVDQNLPEFEQEKWIKAEIQEKADEVRKIKKMHFWMKTGTMKLSTVHSFKGWEISTLFLIIDSADRSSSFTEAEVIYTGLTRARINLIIFNLGNTSYDRFFKNEIEANFNVDFAKHLIEE